MKRHILITLCLLALAWSASSAQPRKDGDWKQKMMNEKIAFLTTEIDITPEEAQAFWPVYNQLNKEKDEIMHKIVHSYKELSKALDEGRTEKEIEKLLETYLAAMQEQREADEKAAEKFSKVLSTEKVARLFIAEERFRRNQIHKLHENRKQER